MRIPCGTATLSEWQKGQSSGTKSFLYIFNVADIANAAIGIETLLREDEDGGEEGADEG